MKPEGTDLMGQPWWHLPAHLLQNPPMADVVPERVQRAVEALDVDPAANVLEVGCGAVADGRVVIRQCELKDFDSGGRRFDVIFAINVNVFWAQPASAEIAAVQSLLTPNGALFLFYEQPPGASPERLSSTITSRLTDAGFLVDADSEQLLKITAWDRRVGRCSSTARA